MSLRAKNNVNLKNPPQLGIMPLLEGQSPGQNLLVVSDELSMGPPITNEKTKSASNQSKIAKLASTDFYAGKALKKFGLEDR